MEQRKTEKEMNEGKEETDRLISSDVFPFESLPNELKLSVFLKLGLQDLARTMRVSREWYEIINAPSTWKQLCEKDLKDFLYSKPLEEIETPSLSLWKSDSCGNAFAFVGQERQPPSNNGTSSSSPVHYFNEEWEEWKVQSFTPDPSSDDEESSSENSDENSAVRFFIKKRKAKFDLEREEKIPRNAPQTRDWLGFYQFCKKSVNLSGVWTACYGTHGDEFVQVDHQGYNLRALKITGDIHVPAGKPTFNICLSSDLKTGKGEIHLAEANYESPRWGEASFQLKDENSFDVMWPFQTTYHSFICTLHFRRKPDHIPIPLPITLIPQPSSIETTEST